MDSRSFANLTLGKTGQLAQGPLPRARPLSRPSARTLAARPIVARRSRDYRLVNTVNLNVTGWDNFSGHLHYPAIGFLVVDCLLIALPPIPGAN